MKEKSKEWPNQLLRLILVWTASKMILIVAKKVFKIMKFKVLFQEATILKLLRILPRKLLIPHSSMLLRNFLSQQYPLNTKLLKGHNHQLWEVINAQKMMNSIWRISVCRQSAKYRSKSKRKRKYPKLNRLERVHSFGRVNNRIKKNRYYLITGTHTPIKSE